MAMRTVAATAIERASTRRRADYNYEGVVRLGKRVVWACGHVHQIGRGYRPPWHGTMTALDCAERELKRREASR